MPTAKADVSNVRVPRQLLRRVRDLVPQLQDEPDTAALGRVTTTGAVRLLLLRGIESTERKAGHR